MMATDLVKRLKKAQGVGACLKGDPRHIKNLCSEAAAEIAENSSLQERFDKLTTLVGGIVIELGCQADSEAVFEAIGRLKELEAECDRWAETSNEQDDVKRDLRARALRAEQERDEARAALKAEHSRGSYHCD